MRNPFRFITHDWPWKIAAAVFALFVFLGVRKSFSYTQTMMLPVEAVTMDGAQALTGFDPGVVAVTFRGSEQDIRGLSFPGREPPRVRVTLRQPSGGAFAVRVKLSHRDVEREGDVRIISIEPNKVLASFDTSDTQTLPIAEPIIKGAPEVGAVKLSFTPQTVEVTGSKARLAELLKQKVRLDTAIVDVSNRREGFRTAVRVLPPDNKGGWTLRPDTVQVDVQFVREDIRRVFPNLPVSVLQSRNSSIYYEPEVRTVAVTVHGTKREVEALDASDLRVWVSELRAGSRTNGGRQRVVPHVVLPYTNRVERISVEPSEFFIRPVTGRRR
ncbi:MAG: CdaR family protein [Kiritimatiellia bacterium]